MSSSQPFSLSITHDDNTTYLSLSGLQSTYVFASLTSNKTGTATLKDAAKNILFPNATAHPTKLTLSMLWTSSGSAFSEAMYIDSTQLFSQSGSGSKSKNADFTSSAVTGCTKSSNIYFQSTYNGSAFSYIYCREPLALTFYFTRYDFTATAGSNVASASVSSSTGYDGDTITYSCVLASGATFEGWYNGSTRVSTSQTYTHTVNGADLSLTAKATAPTTKTLSATYNGAQLRGFPISVSADVPISYNGASKGSVPFSGGSKTFQCANKLALGNIVIGSKTLQCANKIMATNVVATIS